MDLLEVLKKINEIESFNSLEIELPKEIVVDELTKLNNYEQYQKGVDLIGLQYYLQTKR